MCGIVGYTGSKNAKDIVIEGLYTLEYRGYDSAGIALGGNKISVTKTSGRVSELESKMKESDSTIGIGHTRWATHGGPTTRNAHPHLSFNNKIAIVHNGIIENCDLLKKEVMSHGIVFNSDTDSEIIAHLVAMEDQSNMVQAIENVAAKIEGAANFLVIREGDNNIYCHKKNAALNIGIGEDVCVTFPYLLHASSLVIIKKPLYHYVQHCDSMMHRRLSGVMMRLTRLKMDTISSMLKQSKNWLIHTTS